MVERVEISDHFLDTIIFDEVHDMVDDVRQLPPNNALRRW